MKWALVLSGGGAKGFSHAGVIKKIEEKGYPRPSIIAGTSMGAIIAGLYAYGKTSEQIYEHIEQLDFTSLLDNMTFKLPSFSVSRILQAGTAMGSVLKGRAVDSGKKALEELKKIFGDVQFEDLPIPFACAAVDLLTGKDVVLNTGSVAEAIRASMSYPGLFEPVSKDGMLLVDGGVLNNEPCDIARQAGIKKILAINFGLFKEKTPEDFNNGIDVLLRCFDIASSKVQKPIQDLAKLSISIDGGFSTFDFNKSKDIVAFAEKTIEDNSKKLDLFFHKPFYDIFDKIINRK